MRTLSQSDAKACFDIIPDDVRQDLTLLGGRAEDPGPGVPDVSHVWLDVKRTDERQFALRVNIDGTADEVLDPLPGGGVSGGEAPNWQWGSRHHHDRDRVAAPAQYAFRCRTCGHFEAAAHAGVNAIPDACSVCDAGVVHDPEGRALGRELADPKTTEQRRQEIAARMMNRPASTAANKQRRPENWEVLADLSEDQLKAHGLKTSQVVRHVPLHAPVPVGRPPRTVHVTASDGVGTKDQVAANVVAKK